ncbi:hypothetical protein BKA67DRAFT_553613 [Truncatella angustata]|uniref:BZIP domain-containing protein n=1 Tax=Truncatella angustata TaxID=152316 RepID=A0A9P9A054_9PEZI|nr:uncharacterized protein BKA67DRAFT_553613 [Truncatella angustata]KAH6656913.1 hypothetical protein BKA67DRAFT_553613 [Truncatella angustata]KAH8196493.1 hypothetical protein TruAng_009323 [Truncatella angustata]
MATSVINNFPPFNNNTHQHLDNSFYWDDWYQHNPRSSIPFAAPTHPALEHKLSLDPTLQSMISSVGFVNPDCLQSLSTASTSPVSSQSAEDNSFIPAGRTKRRRASKGTNKPTSPQYVEYHDALHEELHHKGIAEPVRRERNRTAAAKCRAKSKAAEEVLKEKQQIERERNQVLRNAFDELSNEVLALKHELLCHSACNHPVIDNYLRHSADQISRGMSLSSTSTRSSPRIID